MATVRRMREGEAGAVLRALESGGSTARSEDSWRQDRMTALVLAEGDALCGVMPLARREVRAAPGNARVNVGWLSSNQFASRMGLRRGTRGTFGAWAELLPEVDALLAVVRDERSPAARWYEQTGFHGVLSIRCLYLDMQDGLSAVADAGMAGAGSGGGGGGGARYHVQTVSAGDAGFAERWQAEMWSVYQEVYRETGGAVPRGPGFWQGTLAHHFYQRHYQFQVLGLWTGAGPGAGGDGGGTLMGYAVVGWSGWHSKRPRMDILELATRQWDTGVASALIRAACELAWSKNVHQVRAVVSVHDPYRGHLARSGFVDRWGYLMQARWLHAQRYLDRVRAEAAASVGAGCGGGMEFAAPGMGPLWLRGDASPAGGAVLRVESDGAILTRLLLHRLDVPQAVEEGRLAVRGGSASGREGSAEAVMKLSMAFRWTPWIFHMLDYI
ncbi:MAG TPA: hypothetical protein VH253_01855 [Phycisphaerae bacterium]|nr:hypothetical protein [Phycisphaerae bacterium]